MNPKLVRYAAMGLMVLVIAMIGYQVYLGTQNPIDSLQNYGEAHDYTLPNVDGDNFTLSDSSEKVRIMTFIYTKCNQGCSTLTYKFLDIKNELIDQEIYSEVQMITIDFDYRFDTMDDLREFRNIFTNSTDTWQFLLGDENQTLEVTEEYNFYFELDTSHMNDSTDDGVALQETDHSNHSVVYIHPFITYFIDQHGDIRAMQGGLDWTVDKALNIVNFLLEES